MNLTRFPSSESLPSNELIWRHARNQLQRAEQSELVKDWLECKTKKLHELEKNNKTQYCVSSYFYKHSPYCLRFLFMSYERQGRRRIFTWISLNHKTLFHIFEPEQKKAKRGSDRIRVGGGGGSLTEAQNMVTNCPFARNHVLGGFSHWIKPRHRILSLMQKYHDLLELKYRTGHQTSTLTIFIFIYSGECNHRHHRNEPVSLSKRFMKYWRFFFSSNLLKNYVRKRRLCNENTHK